MADVLFNARRLVKSNLGWFLRTRETIGEAAGRERAININRDIFDQWFPGLPHDFGNPIEITTRYFHTAGSSLLDSIKVDTRTIRRQGGGKNWRLAGAAIEGMYYDMREGDLLLMAFDKNSATLAWTVCRGDNDLSRGVPLEEVSAHFGILGILGPDQRNMWSFDANSMDEIIEVLKPIQPRVDFLLTNFSTTDPFAEDKILLTKEEAESIISMDFNFDPNGVFDGKVVANRAIATRQGQAGFRKNLLVLYKGKCAVTATRVEQILDAAHIIPYNGKQSNHPKNGLLLRTDIHTLFDKGLITK